MKEEKRAYNLKGKKSDYISRYDSLYKQLEGFIAKAKAEDGSLPTRVEFREKAIELIGRSGLDAITAWKSIENKTIKSAKTKQHGSRMWFKVIGIFVDTAGEDICLRK